MKKPDPGMTLGECLEKFPELEDALYLLIGECIYCEGFKDETLREVFKAHKLNPEKSLKKLIKALGEENV